MRLLEGNVVKSPIILDSWAWLGSITWVIALYYILIGIGKLLGWKHIIIIEENDPKSLLIEYITFVGLTIFKREIPIDKNEISLINATQRDPRLLIMGISFMAITWAMAAYNLVLFMKSIEYNYVISFVFLMMIGLVVNIFMWIITQKTTKRLTQLNIKNMTFSLNILKNNIES